MEELIHLSDQSNLPLSSNQKRLWILYHQDKLNPAYNIQLTYHLEGRIDPEVFRKSLGILFERQHTMFSVFRHNDGYPYIEILPRQVELELKDFSTYPVQSRREEILSFTGEDSRKPFDIEIGPLYKLYLMKEDENSYFFHATVHHLIFDGLSRRIFVLEFSRIYTNLIRGKDISLKPLRYYSYDCAEAEKKPLASEKEKELVDFWKEYLKDCPPELKFPYDFPRKNEPTGFGCREHFIISDEYSKKLREVSKETNTSLFNTVLSLLGIVLRKYTGENNVCVGIPVSNRRSCFSFEVFGLFVNTIVVKLPQDDETNFRDHIINTKESFDNSIQHSELSFDKIVGAVSPERNPGINPFFQVSLSWINNLTIPMDLGGIKGRRTTVKNGVSPFDISFYMWEEDGHIEGEIEYNTDILKQETILRLKDHLLILIGNLLENNNLPVSSASMLSEEDLKMISSVNANTTDYPKDKTIIQLFEKNARLYPDKPALVFKENSLTYRQLNERTNQLARVLRNSNVRANDPVGILVDRSVDMIVGIFGILKAGGAYVPLDPEYPEFRKNFIIKDSGCKILVTQDKYLAETTEEIAKISMDSSSSYHNDKSNIECVNGSSDLAYIIYTSGTTGVPKGSLIPQQGVVRLVCNTNYVDFTFQDRVLQSTSIVFDASTVGIFGALLNGATLYVVDKETILNPDILGDELAKNNITMTDFPTAVFTQIAELRADIFHKLRTILIGGDALSAPHVNKVRKHNPKITVINEYGPTENSCNSTAYQVDRDFDNNIPIGKPISNSTAYIFDKNMNYQPIGIIGELYVGGDGLSKGYLNRDDLNKTCFIEHPYLPGKRLYKTGDLARWLPDWNIEFHGRIDNQLKIRGFRVELGEIESVILGIDGIIETVIKPIKIEEGDYKLIAFLNVPETFKMDSKEIGSLVKEKLPSYMVPSAYKLMNGFPKTVNGKIDRKALEYDLQELKNKSTDENYPLTITERIIHGIWCEALKTKDISTIDNFFEIGGNSLQAIRLINKIKEEFGFTLTFKAFISNPTIIQLANYIDSQSQTKKKTIELVHLTETTNLPLTFNQKRLWLISKLQSDIASYIIPNTFKFSGTVNVELFKKSIEVLFNRHQILFSLIREKNSEPYCDIVKSEVNLSYNDYSGLPDDEKASKVDEIFKGDLRKAFNLENGPLFRLYLIKTGSDKYFFRISIHHIVFDGWSWSVLANDLNKIYNSLLSGNEIELEPLYYQQYDFAQWEKSYAGSEQETESISFWKENLEGSNPILNFPFDFQRTEEPSGRGGYESFKLSKGLSEKLRQISKSEGSSLFATMLSAFGLQMQKYSGEDDINIGLPIAYRPHSKLENIFGMFVNTVVVRLKYEKESSFRNIVRQTNDAAMNAIAHQDLPFEKVVEIVNPERSSNANPLFQVAFDWMNDLDQPLILEGINSERVTRKDRASIFDITFYMRENAGQIEGGIEYNIDILKRETIIRLRDNFVQLVQSVVEYPDQAISEISIISKEEKRYLLETLNDTKADYPKDKTIVDLFEQQVEQTPKNIAVVFEDTEMTYEELNMLSNQMGDYLRLNYYIKPDDLVGIKLERSEWMIVAIMGVLKSGGAYVPIDPDYPKERIDFMVNDSACKVLIDDKELDQFIKTHKRYSQKNLLVGLKPNNLMYCIYTSGSTGNP
ncbi:MAG: amino acid adenylation domain-containing protein, partial [Bacteroidota bacterium]